MSNTNNIEFIEETHTYLYKGVIIPSVSEIIRFKYPDAYQGVPERILKNKAEYGTKVHHYVEEFALGRMSMEEIQKKRIDPNIKIAVEQFEQLRKKWIFHIKSSEQIITYKGKFGGQYDLLTDDDLIIDIKTTATLHEDWLALQLGLYQLALGINQPTHYCLHLPKSKAGKVVPINVVPIEECKEIIKEYEKQKKSSD